MIRGQCSAYCQCAYCANKPERDGSADDNVLRFTNMDAKTANMTKDELYAKSLHDSIRTRALLSSSKNASKFIPDEQLLSSAKRRGAKEAGIASQMVPLRRRDRLEELLLLEHKARIREEGRLRAARRAAGLPDEDEDDENQQGTPVESVPQTPSSVTSSQDQKRGSGSSTPASRCSADRGLRDTLMSIKEIVDEHPVSGKQKPLTNRQIYKLRQLVHNQGKKNRAAVEACENQPHICNHCFSVNVQARHLCPQMTGSVAFEQTGKVINPDEGIKFGTDSKRGLDGTYNASTVDQRMLSSKSRLGNYNPRPYGSGVVFLPVQSTPATDGRQASTKSVRFEPTFNNNIGLNDDVEADMQYPGSTYNVYDDRADNMGQLNGLSANDQSGRGGVAFIDSGNSNASSQNSVAGATAAAAAAPSANGNAAAKSAAGPVDFSNAKTSSSIWRTTNQVREADMERFVEFQNKMNANSKKVYGSTTTRSA